MFYQKEFLRLGWELIKPLQDPQSVEQSITLQKGITVLNLFVEKESGTTEIVIEIPLHNPKTIKGNY